MIKDNYLLKKIYLLLFIPLALYFYFGLQHLAKFETADEHYWIYSNVTQTNYWTKNDGRIQQYWTALFSGDLRKTRINDKPGVTLAYVSGVGAWLKTDLEDDILKEKIAPLSKMEKAEKINLYFRLPILIFNGLFSFVLFFLIKKVTKKEWIALFSCTFVLLSPVLLGISQIVNPDSLFWSLGFASILSYLIFLRDGGKKYLSLTTAFLGFSLLTKYSSVILLPFLLAISIAYFIEKESDKNLTEIIRRKSAGYFIIIIGALLIYAVGMPDNLVNMRHFMKGSVGFKGTQYFFAALFLFNGLLLLDAYYFKSKAIIFFRKLAILQKYFKLAVFVLFPALFLFIIANSALGKDLFDLFRIPFDASVKQFFPKTFEWRVYVRQFLPLIFSVSPLVILASIFVWIKRTQKKSLQWPIFVFSFFILVFVAAVTQQKVSLSMRYSIILYPILFTIAAIGIYEMFSLEKRTFKVKILIFLGIIVFNIVSLFLTKPFYFNYTNALLPKQYVIADAWGYGGYEAAEYLNNLPDSKDLRVWSDYNGFCLFFEGSCVANGLTMKNIQKEAVKDGRMPKFDYFVSSRRGRALSSTLWEDLEYKYSSKLDWSLEINGRNENFVRAYKNEK